MRLSNTARRLAVSSLLTISTITVSATALGPVQTFVSIKGQTQGQFKGEATDMRHKDKWFQALAVDFGMKAPYDVATGHSSGKRVRDPVCFTKEAGAASPQILQAIAKNELLPEVVFEFNARGMGMGGAEVIYETITLTNATISSTRQRLEGASATVAKELLVDEVCFTYQKIQIKNVPANTVVIDDWSL